MPFSNAKLNHNSKLKSEKGYKKKLDINIMEKESMILGEGYTSIKAKILIYFHIDFEYVDNKKKEVITHVSFNILKMDNNFSFLYDLKVLCKKYDYDADLFYIKIEFAPNNVAITNKTKNTISFALECTHILNRKDEYILNIVHTLDKTLFRKLYSNEYEYDLKIIASDIENDK